MQARLRPSVQARQAALAVAAHHWPAPDGLMHCRQRVLAASLHPPAWAEAQALVADLQARGLAPLCRQAHGIAAQAAVAAGAADAALHHARQMLAIGSTVDPWTDEPAAHWLQAAAVLRAAGALADADQACARGRAWLLSAADRLPAPDARRLFLAGHPLHCRLMAGDL